MQKAQGNGSGSASATFPAATTPGNLLVGAVAANIGDSINITNPAGWATVPGAEADAGPIVRLIWKIADGTETAVSVTISNNTAIQVLEFSGINATPVDQVGTATGAAATSLAISAAGATTVADELAVAAFALNNSSGGSEAFSNSFTVQNVTNLGRLVVATKILTATGTPTTTASWVTARNPAGVLATFKAA